MNKNEAWKIIEKYRQMQQLWEKERMSDNRADLLKEGIENIYDIPYIEDGNPRHTVDVFSPAGAGKLPVIIEIHGGGYIACEKNINRLHCRAYAHLRYKVVNAEYSLIPEADFHGILNEICEVVRWVENNADVYGFDLNNVYMSGDSAGGHIAALYCMMQGNEKMRNFFSCRIADTKIKAAALTCPAFTFKYSHIDENYGKELNQLINLVFPEKAEDTLLEMLDVPALAETSSFPPMFIITTPDDDLLYAEDIDLGNILTKYNSKCEIKQYLSMGNKLGHVFNVLYPEYEESRCANNDIADFFSKNI